MEIKIDNFTFTLLSKYQSSRLLVQIESRNRRNPKIFWVYPSSSELGLWRCAVHYGTQPIIAERLLYKGKNDKPFSEFTDDNYYDYIQQTFIHLELQRFINLCVNDLPIFDTSSNPLFSNIINPIIRDNLFSACYLYQVEDTNPIHQKYRNLETEREVIETIDDFRRQIKEPPFIELQKSIECGETESTTGRKRTPRQAIQVFSRELKKIYDYDREDVVFEYRNIFSDTLLVDGEVRCIQLSKKKRTYGKANNILLYYLKSQIQPIRESEYKRNIEYITSKEHHMPFLMTTPGAKINEFGMYTEYIPCGAFICKLFDYSTGIHQQCTEEEIEMGRCTRNYSYIGSRYDDIFPFRLDSPELPSLPKVELPSVPKALQTLELQPPPEGFVITGDDFDELYANGKTKRKKRRSRRAKSLRK